MKWPTSGWIHAGIAFILAAILSVVVGYLADHSALEYNIRATPEYGEKGWNSLGAFAAGVAAAFWTFVIASVLIFVIQRIFASKDDTDNPTE
jgi:phosphotransferase system  glucose/maltose/N-acetylglucosamine-specific IIC component